MVQKLKTLQTIHLAICAGMAVAYVFAGNLSIEVLTVLPVVDAASAIYLVIPIAALFLSHYLFKSQLKKLDPKASLEDKFPTYQTASIMRWAILEFAAFLILFQKPEFITLGIGIILYLIYLRPTEDRINNDFQNLG
ncbi:MFS transporter [Flavobacterium sp.]|uniref:MFS transporter n=1 Tax=Flavobacterium sp. TaxID=239 RepID=UPI0039E3B0B2